MISKEKNQLSCKYDKPIIWNISCFGNILQMYLLDDIIKIFKQYNQSIPISTIHGSYSCKYNGGRSALYFESKTNIENKIKFYNNHNIGIKLTFSNMNIHKEQFEEEEMRWYLDLLNETKGIGNGIICVNDDFAELVKKNYPDLDLVASHVKMELETKMGITDTVDYYNSKFDLYDIVVMNTYRAFDDNFLSKITHPEKVEFIVNHSCTTNCQMAHRHHELLDKLQQCKVKCNHNKKIFDKDSEVISIRYQISELFKKCILIKNQNNYDNIIKRFINKEEINHLINIHNINKFKIEGRDSSNFDFIMILHRYLINDESIYNNIYYTNDNVKILNAEKKFLDELNL